MQLSSLLPLWEKVARTKSVPDEGALSIDRSQPLTRLEFAPLIRATLSRKGRGEESLTRAHPPDGQIADSLSSPFRKNNSVLFLRKSLPWLRHPVPLEGRIAIVTDVGAGCGGRGRRFDECADLADGEAVWS
jgi:hypothetical protein